METTASSEFVVALDIGSSRVRCLIAQVTDGRIRPVGLGDEPSRGMRRGEVIDLPAARYAAQRAIAAAEEQAGVEVQTLFVAAGSRHVQFFNNRACIGITREDRTIHARDVQNVLASARRVPIREDSVVIGSLVCSFAVDDVRQVRHPEGMHGTRLEAEVHVITDARTAAENMAACVDPARYQIEGYVFGPRAAAEAVLDDDEKKLGAAVIDIGAGTTGLMVFRDHAPVFSAVVPVGGDHLTSDVALAMDLGLADAARLKEEYASVGDARLEQPILFHRIAREGTYSVDPRRLHAVVDCRVREILGIVRRELFRAGVRPAGVRTVLTGGTARLPGLGPLASSVLGGPVRIGRPRSDEDGLKNAGPEMATVAGMLRAGLEVRREQVSPAASFISPAGRLLSWVRQLF